MPTVQQQAIIKYPQQCCVAASFVVLCFIQSTFGEKKEGLEHARKEREFHSVLCRQGVPRLSEKQMPYFLMQQHMLPSKRMPVHGQGSATNSGSLLPAKQ
jgi:hypothetical protein